MNKNEQIKQTLIETRQRRATQRCLVYEFKIKENKLSKSDFNKLKFLFVQCKWLYNYILSNDIYNFDTKTKTIYSLDKDGNKIERQLNIPAKLVQIIHKEIKQNIKSISSSKKKGRKIGKLKFKSDFNSIELNQYGNTHEIKKNGFRINGFKRPFKVFGLDQIIDKEYEFADAKLLKKPTGFYIKLTCFENLTQNKLDNVILNQKEDVGLDFGIKNNITTSNGEVFNISIEESERLKGLQRKLSRQKKGSNNRYRTLQKLKVEYERLENKKKDFANKLINYLCSKYHTVYIQDEMIKSWHSGLFGKQVQHSCLGLIKNKLKHQSNVYVIDKSYPTTKLCYNCGTLHKDITLKDRTFNCPKCGFSEDRDIKSAKTILFIGQSKNTYIPMDSRNTDVERMSDFLSSYEVSKQSSMKHRSSLL